MSTSNPPPASAPTPPSPVPAPAPPQKRQIVVISHSSPFYWWPLRALGFVMTRLSFFGEYMVTVKLVHDVAADFKVIVTREP